MMNWWWTDDELMMNWWWLSSLISKSVLKGLEQFGTTKPKCRMGWIGYPWTDWPLDHLTVIIKRLTQSMICKNDDIFVCIILGISWRPAFHTAQRLMRRIRQWKNYPAIFCRFFCTIENMITQLCWTLTTVMICSIVSLWVWMDNDIFTLECFIKVGDKRK